MTHRQPKSADAQTPLTREVFFLRMRYLKHLRPENTRIDKLIENYQRKKKKRQVFSSMIVSTVAKSLKLTPEELAKVASIQSEADYQKLCQNSIVCTNTPILLFYLPNVLFNSLYSCLSDIAILTRSACRLSISSCSTSCRCFATSGCWRSRMV